VNLAKLNPQERARVIENREQVERLFPELMDDDYFLSSISAGTGQVARVRYRFRRVRKMFEEVLT
jgi:hypothetical protein